jgi:CheY-like chemotaxis protein
VDPVQQLTNAIANLMWPVLVAIVVWRLYPTIQGLLSSRGFTVKVGGFEFTAQEATDKLVKSTAELQSRVAVLDRLAAPTHGTAQSDERSATAVASAPLSSIHPRHLLWVDDIPNRRAYELAQLEALGVRVEIARSTRAALDLMASRDFDAIVTGLGRSEEGAYSPTAGLSLIQAARNSPHPAPVYVFAANPTSQVLREIEESGGRVVRTSMQLFDVIWADRSVQNAGEKTSGETNT